MNLRPLIQSSGVPSLERQKPARLRGVALVITLILLAVITTLAIAFLGITHRETGAVDSMARTTDAEMAADSALERSKAEIAAVYPGRNTNVAATGPNILGPDMMVSVCCQNYDATPTVRRTISYDRLEADQRITNRYDAAPPVFVDTNRPGLVGPRGRLDDRFFVDLNRNGIFEESGYVTNTTDIVAGAGRFQTEFDLATGNPVINWRIGDPQWIGLLQNPRRGHGPDNRYIGRYAFMVLPAGRSLDVNWIHNEVLDTKPIAGPDTFYRNQGVGGWELNLAGFLSDLNTNYWGNYRYDPYALDGVPSAIDPGSAAFNDAREFFQYRFPNPVVPDSLSALLPLPLTRPTSSLIDVYGNGPLSFGDWNAPLPVPDDPNFSWPGSESRQRFFSVHDLFDGKKLTQLNGFTNRLNQAVRRGNSYDRYTFYRLLSQMGTDSIPEDETGKIHLNYVNIASWAEPNSRLLATDYIPWTTNAQLLDVSRLGRQVDMGRPLPDLFFLSAVTNILSREFPTAGLVTGIPTEPLRIPVFTNGTTLWISNNVVFGPLYSARIHQVLQQVANILDAMIQDATVPLTGQRVSHYPSVFRPVFSPPQGGNIYIVDYKRIIPGDPAEKPDLIWRRPWRVLPDDAVAVQRDDNVFGVPFIIGARSGFPNFNEFACQTVAKAVRRLHFYKEPNQVRMSRIDQQIDLSLANQFAVEVWNSSDTNPYPRLGQNRSGAFLFANRITSFITNNGVLVGPVTNRFPVDLFPTNGGISTAVFGGYSPTKRIAANKFVASTLPEQVFLRLTNVVSPPDRGGISNRWTVTVTNNVRFFMIETNEFNEEVLVDAVSLGGLRAHFDVGDEWASPNDYVTSPDALRRIWDNTPDRTGLSLGVTNQIRISRGDVTVNRSDWANYSADVTQESMTGTFRDFWITTNLSTVTISNTAPFSAYRVMAQTNLWQANDPLVHYTADDLAPIAGAYTARTPTSYSLPAASRNLISIPWGGQSFSSSSQQDYDARLRDSSISGSDAWQFPEGQFANVGWLGRVHRGTPWQTIYLKSAVVQVGTWRTHSGRTRSSAYAASIHPINDWRLLDYFTTTIHPNASQGRLSINQSGLAAWSAVLSGILSTTATNNPNPAIGRAPVHSTNVIVSPAGVYDPAAPPEIVRIVEGINRVRNSLTNREFTRLSQILAVPELSFLSPCLTNPFVNPVQLDPANPTVQVPSEVSDSDYERLPEQILGLLKVGEPRFVVYGWGQSLKPARLGVQYDGAGKIDLTQPLSGPSIDPGTKIVNNYQVTGEVATKSVVRVVFPERESNNPADPGYYRTDYRRPRLVVESFNIIPVE